MLKNRSSEIGSLVVNVTERSKRKRDMERNRIREINTRGEMFKDLPFRYWKDSRFRGKL